MNGISRYTQQSLPTALSCCAEAMNSMEDTVMMLSTRWDMEAKYLSEQKEGTNSSCLRPSPTHVSSEGAVLCSIFVGANLYNIHSMLNPIKEEIIPGPQPAEDSDAAGMKDGSSTKAAAANRHHLRSCFYLLAQPTDCPLPDQPRPE